MNKYTREIVDKLLSGHPFKVEENSRFYPFKLIKYDDIMGDVGHIEEDSQYLCNVGAITTTFIKVYTVLMTIPVYANIKLSSVIFEPETITAP